MKLRIYLDTSVISALFDEKNLERQCLTAEFFDQAHRFDISISTLTLAEIIKTDDVALREKMRSTVASFAVITADESASILTQALLDYHAVPPNSREDAYHIAIAVISGMDYLLSWNFRHIVRSKTRDIVRMITTTQGYKPLETLAPPEIL